MCRKYVKLYLWIPSGFIFIFYFSENFVDTCIDDKMTGQKD